jgi:tetratricopeptide (TPR) repeat protein
VNEALADIDQALQLAPQYGPAYRFRGWIMATRDKPAEALADLTRAIEMAPSDVYGHIARGQVYRQAGKNAEALADLNKAAEINPTFPQVYTLRANLYIHFGRLPEARAEYEQVVTRQAAYASAVTLAYARALESMLRGKYEEGCKEVETRLAENPENTRWLYEMACVYALSAQIVTQDAAAGDQEERSRLYRARAVDLLEQAVQAGYRNFLHLRADPDLDSLRREPRFLALRDRQP